MVKYSSFSDCVSKNQSKKNPEAYCGKIFWATEGKMKERKKKKK